MCCVYLKKSAGVRFCCAGGIIKSKTAFAAKVQRCFLLCALFLEGKEKFPAAVPGTGLYP